MTREGMLEALQADVLAWPQAVKRAGVKNAGGSAYVPVARNNEILRTPDDPEATFEFMTRVWEGPDAEQGSVGWFRIIKEAGPELTWEWLMVDTSRPYASLFSDELRERVRQALEADAGYAVWTDRKAEDERARLESSERIERIRQEMRSGKRKRLFPELDRGR